MVLAAAAFLPRPQQGVKKRNGNAGHARAGVKGRRVCRPILRAAAEGPHGGAGSKPSGVGCTLRAAYCSGRGKAFFKAGQRA